MIDDGHVGLYSFIKFIITLLHGILEKTFLQCAPLYMACVIHIFIAMFFLIQAVIRTVFFQIQLNYGITWVKNFRCVNLLKPLKSISYFYRCMARFMSFKAL